MTYVRLFISLAASYDWDLHQLDIKNVFLHGDLQEKVGATFRVCCSGEDREVSRLRKSLYGFKQSRRMWFGKFRQAIETFGMQNSKSNHSVFYKNFSYGIILLVMYVDDIVIIVSDSKSILSFESSLHNQFHSKDLGMLKYFLGVEVMRSKRGIMLSQRKYVLDLLSEIGKLGAKPCSTPTTPSVQITKETYLKTLRYTKDWLRN